MAPLLFQGWVCPDASHRIFDADPQIGVASVEVDTSDPAGYAKACKRARFIAAAPDLFDAAAHAGATLAVILETLRRGEAFESTAVNVQSVITSLNAQHEALAKAVRP